MNDITQGQTREAGQPGEAGRPGTGTGGAGGSGGAGGRGGAGGNVTLATLTRWRRQALAAYSVLALAIAFSFYLVGQESKNRQVEDRLTDDQEASIIYKACLRSQANRDALRLAIVKLHGKGVIELALLDKIPRITTAQCRFDAENLHNPHASK